MLWPHTNTLLILTSIGLGLIASAALVYINWRILRISELILQVNIDLLAESAIIRMETIEVKEISELVYQETALVREALGAPIPTPSKNYLDF